MIFRQQLAALVALTCAAGTAGATDYYWDTNGAAAGRGSAASPVAWLTNSWSTSSTGTGAVGPWPNATPGNADAALFGGTAGTVQVAADVHANQLRFTTNNYVVAGAGGTLFLEGTAPTIDISLPSNGQIVTVSAPIAGSAGLTLTGNTTLTPSKLTFLELANANASAPNTFAGPLTIEASASLRLAGGAANEQIPDHNDVVVRGVVDFRTSGGASDGKKERVRGVLVTGAGSLFSVGNGSDFEMDSLTGSNNLTAPGISINGNNASVPGKLSITGWAGGSGALTLTDSGIKINTTGATSAIGSRVRLAGPLVASGAVTINNNNGAAGSVHTNTFTNKAFDFLSAAHTIDVAGTLTFTSSSPSHPLEVTAPAGATLTKTGAGEWLYQHAVQSAFTGENRIEGGVLRIGASERLSNAADLVVAGGEFRLDAFSETVREVRLQGGAITGSAGATLTAAGIVFLESGEVTAGLAGAVTVSKKTAGVVRLSGPSTYTGNTLVEAGTLLVNGLHSGSPSIQVTSLGTLGGVGSITGGSVGMKGVLAPGDNGVGTLTVAGAVGLNGGSTLAVEISPSGSDLLAAGSIDLSGDQALSVTLLGAVAPGDYTVATYSGALTGAFDSITPGFSVRYDTPGQIIVSVPALGTPGDYNSDGVVNAADYAVWRDRLGSAVTLPNDTTPGAVSGSDYAVWQNHFGAAGAAAGVVPAPGGGATLLLGLTASGWRRRRHA